MYYPWGWARLLRLPQEEIQEIEQVVCNRDKILAAVLTADSVLIWYVKPCVPIISHRRSPASVQELGKNVLVQWRPDSSMLVVVTERGHLIIYHLVVPTDVKTLYELIDPPIPSLRRESDELFIKELIPPLIFSLAFEVEIEGGVTDIVPIREELMIATKDGKILRFSWEGQEIRDYTLDLKRIPFCVDQQVLRAVPLTDKNVHVSKLSYSPLIGGYALVFNDGRAAFLVASTLNFDPNSVTGIWALQLEDANCVALNHKYKLIAFGRKNSQGIVYCVDEMTGGLTVSHRLILPTRDYPGNPGPISCLRWTPDGTALVLAWQRGGFSIWSTFGTMIMCSLGWDYGPHVSDPVEQNPLSIKSLDWTAEGYQLWMVNAKTRVKKEVDREFMPYPESDPSKFSDKQGNSDKNIKSNDNPLANRAMVLQFVKSPISVNPCMSKQTDVYLQGEDRLFLNLNQRVSNRKTDKNMRSESFAGSGTTSRTLSECSRSSQPSSSINNSLNDGQFGSSSNNMLSSGNKHWTTITIPHNYIGNSWPIRYTALDDACQNIAVAGRTGLAHYNIDSRRWRLFGNETQEKDFIVTGGLLWWKDRIIMGCYNLATPKDEIRIYPRTEKLDNSFAKILTSIDAQVLLINILGDQLVVFSADNVISVYNLRSKGSPSNPSNLDVERVRTYDLSSIPGLNFHPASVVLVGLSTLRLEERHRNTNAAGISVSGSRGDSYFRETSPADNKHILHRQISTYDLPSIIINICGRVVMLQQYHGGDNGMSQTGRESPSKQLSLPTVLASGCETIWFPRDTNEEKPHLTASLWLYCGVHGMRVWLPVFPRHGDHGHTFMSKRIMLHFPIEDFYPLAILFEDAIILGAENDTVLYNSNSISMTCLPYSTLQRTSSLFLHPILRQLIRRNLGYHAWEIARTCMTLPYFQHSLELLLHEVLEEEATSNEPIPDALLPSVIEFIQEFPVFLQTIGRCARKTEVALWHHLFSAVGSPRALFQECISNNDLETASSYLLILQNLEPPSVSQSHATILLDAALDKCAWDLAKELTRFLRTIDPEDAGEVPSRPYNLMAPQSPPIHNTSEEEISLLLGTLQVPRGRTQSIPHQSNIKVSPKDTHIGTNEHKLNRSISESKQNFNKERKRTASSSSAKDQSFSSGDMSYGNAEEFYIDIILQRHARKLLSKCYLRDLGTFAAQLDFQMVSWLTKENSRAARVDNFVNALKTIHSDFSWPYPTLPPSFTNKPFNNLPNELIIPISVDHMHNNIKSGKSNFAPESGICASMTEKGATSNALNCPVKDNNPQNSPNSSMISSSIPTSVGGNISSHISCTNTPTNHSLSFNPSSKERDNCLEEKPGEENIPQSLQRSISANGSSNTNYHISNEPRFSSKTGGISDSGYLSHNAVDDVIIQGSGQSHTGEKSASTMAEEKDQTTKHLANSTQPNVLPSLGPLSEQTIQAMLKPLSYREDLSVLSEDGASNSLMSPSIDLEMAGERSESLNNRLDSPASELSSANFSNKKATTINDSFSDRTSQMQGVDYSFLSLPTTVISKGPPKSEVQLRYLLQIMMEACCLEIASLISIVLKDALALIRIVNAARSCPLTTPNQVDENQKVVVSRIYQNMKSLEVWAYSDCIGYVPFFQTIQPQLNSLKEFLLQQSVGIHTTTVVPGSSFKTSLTPVQQRNEIAATSSFQRDKGPNLRKNSPGNASLPPIYPTSGNLKKVSVDSAKSLNVQSPNVGKPRLLIKKSLDSVGETCNLNLGENRVPITNITKMDSNSDDKDKSDDKNLFSTRSLTLDSTEFEAARKNILNDSISKQRNDQSNKHPINTSASVPNLNESDNQIEIEDVEDSGNCVVS